MLRRVLFPVAALLAFMTTAGFAAGRVASVGMSFAAKQHNSPVEISAVTGTLGYLCRRVELKNVSRQRIVSITFGAMVYPHDSLSPRHVLARGPAVPTDIRPGQQSAVESYLLPPVVAEQKGAILNAAKLRVVVGVLKVGFANGTSWNFNPEASGGF